MELLNSLTIYGCPWEVTAKQSFKEADPKGFAKVKSAQVVETEQEWGTSRSICLYLKAGGCAYIPLSRDSELKAGDKVQPKDLKIITLSREGDDDIYRADVE